MNAATAGLRDCADAGSAVERHHEFPTKIPGASIVAMPIFGDAPPEARASRKSARHESDAEAARHEIEQHLNVTDFKRRLAR